jgi:hypothetical protein
MTRRISSKLNYANVVATIAIFAALGGGAYAATVAKNSVKSSSIKNNQVRSADVKDAAITGNDVNEATLGQVPSAVNADSATSAQSAQTAQTAGSAQSAQTAAQATNADQLGGRSLDRVIGINGGGSTNPDPDITLAPQPKTTTVVSQTIAEGPADTIVTASLSLVGGPAAGSSAICWLESVSSGAYERISQFATIDFVEAHQDVLVTLVGFDNNAPKASSAARARCSSSTGVIFDRGDMVSQITPE